MKDDNTVPKSSFELAVKQRDYRDLQLNAIQAITEGQFERAADAVRALQRFSFDRFGVGEPPG